MSDTDRGLVAKKRLTLPKKLPRLLMGMLGGLPAPTPTKREVEERQRLLQAQELAYQAMDHFELDEPARSEENTTSTLSREQS